MTVAAELAVALHHSRGVGPAVPHEALRGQTPASSGTRPAALKEPVPQGRWPGALRQLGHVVPSLALPSQAGATADGVDSSSLRFLTAAALRKLKEEEMVMMVEDEEEEVAPAVSAAPAPVEEYVAHAPAVSAAPAPVEEYVAHAPAVFAAPAPVDMFVAPAPAVSSAPAPVEEYIAPAPAVSAAPAPVVEYTAHAAVFAAPAMGRVHRACRVRGARGALLAACLAAALPFWSVVVAWHGHCEASLELG